MGNLSIVQWLFLFGTVGLIFYVLYGYLCLLQRSRLLEQKLQIHQQLMKRSFASIHNGPLQMLAFLMREVQIHEVSQQELLQHLREVYQDVLTGVQDLEEGNLS